MESPINRDINQLSSQMPEHLPDIKNTFLEIRNYIPTFFRTIDFSDMFFSKLLHVDSRDITTFTWNNKKCILKRNTSTKFLGVLCHLTDPWFQVVYHTGFKYPPTQGQNADAASQGMSGDWRSHIPYLQIIMKSLRRVTRNAVHSQWGQEHREAFETAWKLISEHATLINIKQNDTLITCIIFIGGYDNWGLFIKQKGVHQYLPVGF